MFRLYPLGCLYPNGNRRGNILQAPVTRGKAFTATRKTAFCRAARMGSDLDLTFTSSGLELQASIPPP
jgi:hypothetical protein